MNLNQNSSTRYKLKIRVFIKHHPLQQKCIFLHSMEFLLQLKLKSFVRNPAAKRTLEHAVIHKNLYYTIIVVGMAI